MTFEYRPPVRRAAALCLASAAALLALSACQDSGSSAPAAADGATTATGGAGDRADGAGSDTGNNAKPQRLLWMGDSISEAQVPAVGAAMEAAGAEFESMASTGGGGVVGEIAEPTWKTLPAYLESFRPDVVAYQITTYDWGTPDEQRAAYERLAEAVTGAGAELLLVSAPPFKVDDFYKPHASEIESAPESAKSVAGEHPDSVRFLDAAALWGTDHGAAEAQRGKDGIHSCQQGSAAFAQWFGKELHRLYDFAPAPAEEWATGSWTGDKVFSKLGCP
ncbi:SGNH/GDSL hydrolase family protein [Streptomyces sp. CHD11]|uniref:SGNH/GDSL hydrolase family protein n=1 Tax=Streptomyces sp. CHD11 TaxID=2741325 RepID=UPI001BFCC5CB|nr:SGNH/GDSL hydrolase family protein [Streptomyces sp. CHD11]MBT3153597.1 SGNH/GDSL hydrolase family protein [Streptomyces sp. CHD11]